VPENTQKEKPPIIRLFRLLGARFGNEKLLRNTLDRSFTGKIGDEATIRRSAEAVKQIYRESGLTAAQVVETTLDDDGTLTIRIVEGTIRSIRIMGNSRTRKRTIAQVLTLRPGDVYDERRTEENRRRLARLGIFQDVQIGIQVPGSEEEQAQDPKKPVTATPVVVCPAVEDETEEPKEVAETAPAPPETPPTADPIEAVPDELGFVDLVVRIREQQTVNLAATVGYTDGIGAIGFVDVSETNLLGTANRVSVQWQRTAIGRLREDGTFETADSRAAFGFSYSVPTLSRNSLAFGVEVYDKNTVFLPFFAGGQETIRSYEVRRGASAQIGRELNDRLSLFLTARRDDVGYDPIPDRLNPPQDELATAAGTVGALGFALIADGRDQADNPRRGYRHRLSVEHSGSLLGGNRVFTQALLDFRGYVPLSAPPKNSKLPPTVLAMRLLGGFSQGDVPLSEQFFLGGFDLLRGYDLFSIRGERAALGVVETRLPLGEGLQGVIFSEVGGAWQQANRFSFNNFRASAGVGIRFLSPIGPIRLDAAYGSRLFTYISLGQSF
jgi:outer membrane protein insertion porin family